MVEPKNDVAVVAIFVIEVGPSNRDRFVSVVPEDSKGACGVEANAANGTRVDVVLVYCSTN